MEEEEEAAGGEKGRHNHGCLGPWVSPVHPQELIPVTKVLRGVERLSSTLQRLLAQAQSAAPRCF